jgi:hypothetical protein
LLEYENAACGQKPCIDIGKELHGGTPLFRKTQCMIAVLLVGDGKNTNYLHLPLLIFFFSLSRDGNVVTLQRAFLAHLQYALA